MAYKVLYRLDFISFVALIEIIKLTKTSCFVILKAQ